MPAAPEFTCAIADSDHGPVVAVGGVVDYAAAQAFGEVLIDLFGDGDVTVDLSGVRYLAASGISSLLEAQKGIEERGGHLSLCGVTGTPRKVMPITGDQCVDVRD